MLCVIPLAGDRWRGSRDGSGAAAFGLDVGQQVAVASLAEQVAGVQVTFAPGFLGRLCELPVVKARAQAAGDRLVVLGALVVAEAVVGQTQRFGQQPALAVVLGKERGNAGITVTAMLADFGLQVVEGDERQDGVAEFGVFVLVDAPETLGVLGRANGSVRMLKMRFVASH